MKIFGGSLRVFLMVLVFFVSSIGSSNEFLDEVENRIKLNVTHSVYTAIIAHHFEDQFSVYDPVLLADRIFFLTFLNKWKEKIETGKFKATRDIFSSLLTEKTFVTRFYRLWYQLHNSKKNLKQLRQKNWDELVSVGAIYRLESKGTDLDSYAKSILEFVSASVIANQKDYSLAMLFYEGFYQAKNKELKSKALSFKENIAFRDSWDKISLGFDISSLALAGAKLANLPGKIKSFFTNRASKDKVTSSSAPGRWRSLRKKVNPLIKKRPRLTRTQLSKLNPFSTMPRAITTSSAAHVAGFAAWFQAKKEKENISSNVVEEIEEVVDEAVKKDQRYKTLEKLIIDFENFYFVLLDKFPIMINTGYKDFPLTYIPKDEKWVTEQAMSFVKEPSSQKSEDFAQVILQAEKHLQVDERPYADPLAMEIVFSAYKKYEERVAQIFSESTGEEALEEVRRLVLTGHAESYIRDNPSLTSLFLDWGGNCVSQTAIMVSLLYPYQDQLPEGQKLGVYIEWGHIEPALFSEENETFDLLVRGKRYNADGIVLLKPEYLMLRVARNFMGVHNLGVNITDLIAFDMSGKAGREELLFYSKLKEKISAFFDDGSERQKGALDTGVMSDILSVGGREKKSSRLTPAEAILSYSKIDTEVFEKPQGEEIYGTVNNGETTGQELGKDLVDGGVLGRRMGRLSRESKKQEKKEFRVEVTRYQAAHHLDFFELVRADHEVAQVAVADDQLAAQLLFLQTKKENRQMEFYKVLHDFFESKIFQLKQEGQLFAGISNMDFKRELMSCTTSACRPNDIVNNLQRVQFLVNQYESIFYTYISHLSAAFSYNQAYADIGEAKLDQRLKKLNDEAFEKEDAPLKLKEEIAQAFGSAFNERKNFYSQFFTEPKSFFKFFNRLSGQRRELFYQNMTETIGGDNHDLLSEVMMISFNKVAESLPGTLGAFLYSLDKIKVISGQKISTVTVNLPFMRASSAEALQIIKQFNVGDVERDFNTDRIAEKPAEDDISEREATEVLTFQDDILLESTYLFSNGFHLWTPEVLQILKKNRYRKYNASEDDIHFILYRGLRQLQNRVDVNDYPLLSEIESFLH